MPFSTTASIISTDLDNMVRGLYHDNSDSSLTGTVAETTLKGTQISGNTIGPTGGLHIIAAGTLAGTAGTKTIRLRFGSALITTITQAAGTTSAWHFDIWIFNSSVNAQRIIVRSNVNDSLTLQENYTTASLDTTANQSLLVNGQLGNAGDTITQTMFEIFIVQIN